MADTGQIKAMRSRGLRVFGQHTVAQSLAKVRAIIGPSTIPASEPEAQAALEKLQAGEEPTPAQLAALEIAIRLMRPVVFSRGGALDDLPDEAGHNLYTPEYRAKWTAFRKRVQPWLYSIGRIELPAGRHVATGFLVGRGLLATNRHVADLLTHGTRRLVPGHAQIVFKQEYGSTNPPDQIHPLRAIRAVHGQLDLALIELEPDDRLPIALSRQEIKDGDEVVTIGYPGEDTVNNPLFLEGVFQNGYGVKRAALGEVLAGVEAPGFEHDCSTTQGNSGSPIFSLATGALVGVHKAGYFMYRNEAVQAVAAQKFIEKATQ